MHQDNVVSNGVKAMKNLAVSKTEAGVGYRLELHVWGTSSTLQLKNWSLCLHIQVTCN